MVQKACLQTLLCLAYHEHTRALLVVVNDEQMLSILAALVQKNEQQHGRMAEHRMAERRNGRTRMANRRAAEWVEQLQQVTSATYPTECWQMFWNNSKTVQSCQGQLLCFKRRTAAALHQKRQQWPLQITKLQKLERKLLR